MGGLDWLDDELGALERTGLLRVPRGSMPLPGPHIELGGRSVLNLCSNDYLSLAGRPATGVSGSGASRLVVGDLDVHQKLERALAAWLHVESALLFSSGYAANVGVVSALAGAGSVVISDALNHASIVDGCRLSRARVVVVPHRSIEAVEAALRDAPERRRLIVTDGYFSMDATRAPVAELARVAGRYGAALVVDEAHGLGVWGPDGRGVSASEGITPDVIVGTLGKSFGAAGAFVAGSGKVTRWLWNRARSFVFSTGLAPSAATSALSALPEVRSGERTARLMANAALVRRLLGSPPGEGPIIPLLVGQASAAVAASERLLDEGLFVQAIRPPTVPKDTSRLRLTVQAGHEPAVLEDAARRVREVLACFT